MIGNILCHKTFSVIKCFVSGNMLCQETYYVRKRFVSKNIFVTGSVLYDSLGQQTFRGVGGGDYFAASAKKCCPPLNILEGGGKKNVYHTQP